MTEDLPEMRASDADRDAIAERLREGYAEGRLDNEEFEERLESAYAARTRGELARLVADLPQPSEASSLPAPGAKESSGLAGSRWRDRYGAVATSRTGIAVMGGFVRRGSWVVPRVFRCFAVMGGGQVDLRRARFESRVVEIKVTAIMGGVEVVVPHDAEVEVNGIGIMGGFEQGATGAGSPDAPRVVVSGIAFWGGVDVKRKRPPAHDAHGGDRDLPGGPRGPHSLH